MKKALLTILALVMVLSMAGCGVEDETPATEALVGDTSAGETPVVETPETVEQAVITIGVDDTYPPMEFRDDNNDLVGFDIDFAKALGEEMGVEIEFKPTAWDGIFSALNSGKYDVIISSVSITPDRLEGFEFSKPYLSNGQVIVVKPGDTSIKSAADLAGKTVGVQLETTADIAAAKQKAMTEFELKQYDDIIQTFSDMKTGRLDAIVVDYAVAIDYVANNPEDYEITTAQLTNEPIGVCIKKGNTAMKDKVDAAITALQENGSLVPISEEWLGGNYVTDIDEELR